MTSGLVIFRDSSFNCVVIKSDVRCYKHIAVYRNINITMLINKISVMLPFFFYIFGDFVDNQYCIWIKYKADVCIYLSVLNIVCWTYSVPHSYVRFIDFGTAFLLHWLLHCNGNLLKYNPLYLHFVLSFYICCRKQSIFIVTVLNL